MNGMPGPEIEPETAPDDELARRFAAERALDARSVPGFTHVLARGRAGRRHGMLRPAMALGVAAVVLVTGGIWRRAATGAADPAFVVVPGEMRVPTDFLLDIAGGTMRAGEVPSIGAIDWYPLADGPGTGPASTRRN